MIWITHCDTHQLYHFVLPLKVCGSVLSTLFVFLGMKYVMTNRIIRSSVSFRLSTPVDCVCCGTVDTDVDGAAHPLYN